jgi:hypothetical protein
LPRFLGFAPGGTGCSAAWRRSAANVTMKTKRLVEKIMPNKYH